MSLIRVELSAKTIAALADAVGNQILDIEIARSTGLSGQKCRVWKNLKELQKNKQQPEIK